MFFNLTDQFLDRHEKATLRKRRFDSAIRFGDSIRTYGDLAVEVNRVGEWPAKFGVARRATRLVRAARLPEFTVAYFAVTKIAAVAVPTSTAARSADYDYLLRESKADSR